MQASVPARRPRALSPGTDPGIEAPGEPLEGRMKRTVNSTAPWFLARLVTEVYCRRENRMVATCPGAKHARACPCLHGVETADALFEPNDGSDQNAAS